MKKIVLTLLLLLTLTACGEVEYSITLNEGKDVVFESEIWTDEGCTITINGEDFVMERVEDIDYSVYDRQEITYSYTYKRVEYICKRVVMVIEDADFNVALVPGQDTINVGESHNDKGIIFLDDNEDDFTVVKSGDVNINVRGTYIISYTIYDMDGRYITLYRIVNVI